MAEIHESAERDYMLGMKYKDIAEKYKVAIDTVKSWKKRYGWQRVKEGAHKAEKGVHTKETSNRVQNSPAVIIKDVNELTEKQRLFCQYYLKNFNATMAYLKAYKCSYDVANAEGYKFLVKPCIRSEIQRMKDIKSKSIMINEDDIIERYMRIAFADMTDFTEFGTKQELDLDANGAMQIDSQGNIKTYKVNYMDFKNHDEVDGGLICEISMGRSGMKVKLEDRQKALAWLSDYFNMNPMNQHKIQYNNAVLALREKESARNDW